MDQIQQIPLEQICPREDNRRVGGFDQAKLEQLADSIRAIGVQQPIIVRKVAFPPGPTTKRALEHPDALYELVAGERRWRSAKLAGLEALPCVVRDLDDATALKISTIENLQREDIHPLDEADGYARLIERAGCDVARLAAEIGKSASYVYQRLKLRDLVAPARQMLVDGTITAGHAILIARLPAKQQERLLKNIDLFPTYGDDHVASVRRFTDEIRRNFLLDLTGAAFRKDDADLVPKAGPCSGCPKRTGFVPELFADVCKEDGRKRDYCTDRSCFSRKLDAHLRRRREALEGKDYVKVSSSNFYGTTKEGEVVPSWRTEECKKDDKGAKLALIVNGPDRGKTKHVRVRPEPRGFREPARDEAAQKREALERDVEDALEMRLIERIAESETARIKDCGIPEDRLQLLLEGLAELDSYHFESLLVHKGWATPERDLDLPTVAELHLSPAQLLQTLFEFALVGLRDRLGTTHKDSRIAALVREHGIDVKALKAEIRREIKDKEKVEAAQEKTHA